MSLKTETGRPAKNGPFPFGYFYFASDLGFGALDFLRPLSFSSFATVLRRTFRFTFVTAAASTSRSSSLAGMRVSHRSKKDRFKKQNGECSPIQLLVERAGFLHHLPVVGVFACGETATLRQTANEIVRQRFENEPSHKTQLFASELRLHSLQNLGEEPVPESQ